MRETGTNSNEPAVTREAPMCEDRTRNRPLNCELYHISTESSDWPRDSNLPPCCPAQAQKTMTSNVGNSPSEPGSRPARINWQLKAVLPVAFVLLNGLLLFLLATVSLRDTERHAVLIVAGAGAVAICAVLILVLAYLV